MKLGSQIVPPATDPNDAASQTFVERLGGRGAPEFISAELSADQLNVGVASTVIAFDTVLGSRGLTVNGSGRFSGLKAGRTYWLQCGLYVHDATGGSYLNWHWYNVTGAATISKNGSSQTTTETSHDSAQPTASVIFTPTEDTEVEIRVVSGLSTCDVGEGASYANIVEISGPAIAGPMEFIEEIEVTGADAQDITFSGLNGDEDGHYFLVTKWVNGTVGPASVECEIRPNSISTGGETEGYTINSAVLTADRVARILLWGSTGSDYGVFTTHIHPQTGAPRGFTSEGFISVAASTGAASKKHGHWNDTSTNITSLLLHADVADGFGVGTKFTLYRIRSQNFPENSFPPGHLDGLATSFNSISLVDIAPGTCKDSTGTVDITVRSTLTANMATTGANGKDLGIEASSTWYALFVIYGIGKAVASLLSVSGTAPTLPAGYTHFRRVGWVWNTSGSNIARWIMRGSGRNREVWWDAINTDFSAVLTSGGSDTYAAVDCSATAPPTATKIMFQYGYLNNSSNTRYFSLKPTGSTDEHFTHRPGSISATERNGATPFVPCNSSQSIDYRVSAVSASNVLSLFTHAYVDEL
jgi:hypothetical protein